MKQQFNKLYPEQAERLFLLLEEMGEAQQIIGKILRHGYDSTNPIRPGDDTTNRLMLEKEMGDVMAALFLLTNGERFTLPDLDMKRIEKFKDAKLGKVIKYLHHQGSKEVYFDRLYKRI